MAIINNIKLINFRNFKNFNISPNQKLNILFGKNGCGKTNILEAISLLAKGRGLRNSNINNLIKKNEKNFLIDNNIEINRNIYNVKVSTENKSEKVKKIIKINDDLSKESLDFLNQSISYIFFLPEMERLFQASPTYRRNFLDRLIFSSRNDYNRLINRYKKSLVERIKILQENFNDNDWLKNIEKEICDLGFEIYKIRLSQIKFINDNISILKNDHKFPLDFKLSIKDDFFNERISKEQYLFKLEDSRYFDKKYGGTKVGPHKSDLIATTNDEFDASLLSTGQQKTIVLMILLSQCNYLINFKNINPILLLDEIASHLDSNNRQILLDMINRFNIQFFLTGTDKNLFSFVSTNAEFYNITNL